MGLSILVVVAAALLLGLAANKMFRSRVLDDDGPAVTDILGQALTLAVLFMAFVLVEASGSFAAARSAATAEADAVDKLFETAEYLPEPYRKQVTGKVVCYSRAIIEFEWDHMDAGRASQASVWSSGLRKDFKQVYDQQMPLFEFLISADEDRSTSRRERLEVATPKTPALVYTLMLVTLGLSVAGYTFTVGRRRRKAQLASVLLLTLLLTAGLLLIRELERPFGGLAVVTDAQMVDTRDDISEDFQDAYGATLPCDDVGVAVQTG